MLDNYPAMVGIGELTLQCDDINNVTVKGGNWTYTEPSLKKITKVAKEKKRPLIVLSDARSVSTKPYRAAFEYIDEIERVCSEDVDVKVIWVNAGASTRGQWKEYIDIVKKLVSTHSNLYLSFTPDMVTGKVCARRDHNHGPHHHAALWPPPRHGAARRLLTVGGLAHGRGRGPPRLLSIALDCSRLLSIARSLWPSSMALDCSRLLSIARSLWPPSIALDCCGPPRAGCGHTPRSRGAAVW